MTAFNTYTDEELELGLDYADADACFDIDCLDWSDSPVESAFVNYCDAHVMAYLTHLDDTAVFPF